MGNRLLRPPEIGFREEVENVGYSGIARSLSGANLIRELVNKALDLVIDFVNFGPHG